MADIYELEARMAEAWGDAPYLIPCGRVRSESEKSYPFQVWSHSTHGRKSDERRRKKKKFEQVASPTRSYSPFRSCSPLRSLSPFRSRKESILHNRVALRPSAYFSPHLPSSPLLLAQFESLAPPYEDISNNACVETNFDPIFTRREHDPSLCFVIRNMVENIVDNVSELALHKTYVDQYALTHMSRAQAGVVSRGSSALCCSHRNIATRNMAVQAKTYKIKQEKKLKKGHPPEEWSGSVRALRDSHVRLVLRQLRHIERLNRALDRRP